ncbi:MAG TPA: Yip1 family protein [Xanthobacteraceae bacterium]
MDVFKRVKGIMLAPELEWPAIEHEPGTPAYLFSGYVVYLAAIPPLAGFIGSSIIGVTVAPVGTFRVPLFAGLLGAVIEYVLSFVIVYAVAIIIDQFAPRFGGKKDFPNALKLTVYCFTPYWVGGVFQLMAGTRFLAYVVALFGVYLLSMGLPRLMKPPPDRSTAYVVVAAACAIAIVAVISLIENAFTT